MPFPLIAVAWVIGGTLAAAAAAVGADRIMEAWKGKRLAVLGQREVGKTVLIKYLTTGELNTDYEQTTEVRPTDRSKLRMQDLSLRLKKSKDVPGSNIDYPRWKSVHDESDVTIYLFRADRVLTGDADTIRRIEDDLGQIRRWGSSEGGLFLIGTHCDLDPEYSNFVPGREGDYRDRVAKHPALQHARLLSQQAPMIVGSLKEKGAAQAVVRSLLRQLAD